MNIALRTTRKWGKMELARTALIGEDLGPAKNTQPFRVGVLVAAPSLYPMTHLRSPSVSQADGALVPLSLPFRSWATPESCPVTLCLLLLCLFSVS